RKGDATQHFTCGIGEMIEGSRNVLAGGERQADSSCGWMPEELKNRYRECDASRDLLNKAKQANGGVEPTIVKGAVHGDFLGEFDGSNGITLNPNQDACTATDVGVMELNNLIRKPQFYAITVDANNGNMSRDEYIRAYERTEFDSARNALKVSDA